ncbi:NADPH-dependent FMN reductase [Streptomyces sp. NBC_01304]|uniref:NADPH-dependent FMN reductase n=1 Tax=Streptomyces sp. NBC_01304 TaxID=2903818 RepID=UPI002E12440F|nr:NAD(P)H-dependent oxidoreductase [Streptomyces sp. NBC_01304]
MSTSYAQQSAPSRAEQSEPSHEEAGEQTGDRIAVVIGSSRPTRICPRIAAWIRDAAQEGSPLHYDLLDLAEVNLPLLDEPLKAALEQYEHEHTRQWSRTVLSYSGFLFVFPQYNWGYPAVVKNAVDFLYHEWHDKPATVACYGTHGGNKGATQFLTVLKGLHMRSLDDHLELVITDQDVDDAWQLKDVNATLHPYRDQVRAIDEQMIQALKDGQ